jgi:hypothetical protein
VFLTQDDEDGLNTRTAISAVMVCGGQFSTHPPPGGDTGNCPFSERNRVVVFFSATAVARRLCGGEMSHVRDRAAFQREATLFVVDEATEGFINRFAHV